MYSFSPIKTKDVYELIQLKNGVEATTKDLCRNLNIFPKSIYYHLKKLKEKKLIVKNENKSWEIVRMIYENRTHK